MSTTMLMPAEQADWVAEHVLTRTFVKSCGGVDLIRRCACQHGKCGHCASGEHRKCTTRVAFKGEPPAQPHTHIVGRRGSALASAWPSGTACRWVCSCTDCQAGPGNETATPVVAYRKAHGDLRAGDTVWLTPKTPGCPSICWKQPHATVVAVSRHASYVEVKVGRKQHRVHVDNVRRSDPAASHGVIRVKAKPRPLMPDGFEELSLF